MERSRRKAVTIAEVAASAGVSYQTVSRVVNNHPNVADPTRRAVQGAIARLGYRPNAFARSLVTRRSNRVGLITLGARYYGPAQTITHVETALRADGYSLLFATLSAPTLDNLSTLVAELVAQGVDGLVLITPLVGVPTETVQQVCDGVPFVLVDAEGAAGVRAAAIDQRRGGRLAAEHLLSLGHTRVAEISGPLGWWDARERHEGVLEVLDERGLTLAGSIEGTWEAESGYRGVRELLGQNVNFTALVAGNDAMALGALKGLREGGLRVPEDVSVVGFDDLPEAAFFEPPLSSVRGDFPALGQRCADLIVELIGGREPPGSAPLLPTLSVRSSTAPPKRSG